MVHSKTVKDKIKEDSVNHTSDKKVTAIEFGCEPSLDEVDYFKYLYAIFIQISIC